MSNYNFKIFKDPCKHEEGTCFGYKVYKDSKFVTKSEFVYDRIDAIINAIFEIFKMVELEKGENEDDIKPKNVDNVDNVDNNDDACGFIIDSEYMKEIRELLDEISTEKLSQEFLDVVLEIESTILGPFRLVKACLKLLIGKFLTKIEKLMKKKMTRLSMNAFSQEFFGQSLGELFLKFLKKWRDKLKGESIDESIDEFTTKFIDESIIKTKRQGK